MSVLWRTLFEFPTGIMSVLLIIVLLYWLLVLLGALDLELLDADADVGADGGGLWSSLGLIGVPASIGLSFAVLFGWMLVAALNASVGGAAGPSLLLGTGILGAGVIGGLLGARVAIKPLRPLFRVRGAVSANRLVGKVCTITTSRVDQVFGQARLEDGADDLHLQVRADPKNRLARGTRALLVSYDVDEATFQVVLHDDTDERRLLEQA